MAIDEKALDEFLVEFPREDEIPAEVLIILKRIWARNDSRKVKRGPGYISKQKAAEFFRSQGMIIGVDRLAGWARFCGRFSWDQK